MNLKIIGYTVVVILGLALAIGVGVKLTQKAEGYKAQDDQFFYSFEPHFFIGGCARYDATRQPDDNIKNTNTKKAVKLPVKKLVETKPVATKPIEVKK